MNLTQFAEWLIEAYHSDDGMPEAKEICREARAALSAQPVEGADAESKAMFVARLENMSLNGDTWLTIPAVLALLNDCDMLATQAAPAPEPSAQAVAHPSHQTVREWMPVSEALRLSDLWTAGDLDNCGQWRAAIKVLADEVRALAASPQREPSAQAVAGAVATDETGWLIEHSGEILPGAEQRAQVSWLRVQMKFNGYGAREFGFTHDANEALRFARKEDAEAVLAMHLGADPPDWYSKPFSVTEHMWPAASQAQAAPAPEPSAQAVREPGDPLHDDAYVRGVAVGFVEDDSRRTTLLRIADRMQKLAASPQPEPSAKGEPVAWRPNVKCTPEQNFNAGLPNQQTIDYWKNIGCGIEYAYAAPSTPPPAVVEAVPLTERWVVVCESVLDVGFGGDVREGGRPELGYALLANATTFDSEDKAKAAIRNAKLPIGWVYMPLSRLLPDLRGIAPKAAQEKT